MVGLGNVWSKSNAKLCIKLDISHGLNNLTCVRNLFLAIRDRRSRAFFKSGQDLSISYARNFVHEGSSAVPPGNNYIKFKHQEFKHNI